LVSLHVCGKRGTGSAGKGTTETNTTSIEKSEVAKSHHAEVVVREGTTTQREEAPEKGESFEVKLV